MENGHGNIDEGHATSTLCSPGQGLSCFACCPPIRPPGYDHLPWKSSLARLMVENRAAWLAGRLPAREIIGFWCPGLGFLDRAGKTAGCLFHPANNRGVDMRHPTGYQAKCARESCPASRAFARLTAGERERLLRLCRGMDPFRFGSPAANPLMRLLALGPRFSRLAAALPPPDLKRLAGLRWHGGLHPAMGWLVGRFLPEELFSPDLASRVRAEAHALAVASASLPDHGPRRPAHEVFANEWEARFWRRLTGKNRFTLERALALRRLFEQGMGSKGRLFTRRAGKG